MKMPELTFSAYAAVYVFLIMLTIQWIVAAVTKAKQAAATISNMATNFLVIVAPF